MLQLLSCKWGILGHIKNPTTKQMPQSSNIFGCSKAARTNFRCNASIRKGPWNKVNRTMALSSNGQDTRLSTWWSRVRFPLGSPWMLKDAQCHLVQRALARLTDWNETVIFPIHLTAKMTLSESVHLGSNPRLGTNFWLKMWIQARC